ncbi:26158_t:CDS:2, partial [Racocetra persica]
KLTLREAINFIFDMWNDVNDITIKNCWKATKIMPKASKSSKYKEEEDSQEESRPENELEYVISKTFLIENNLGVQELINNIEKYTHLIDQLVVTEDALTDKGIIEMATEALKKVIKFQESLEVRKGFDEKELKML